MLKSNEESWVSHHTGVTLETLDGQDVYDHINLALRLNPKRAHLLVSSILGKHVPVAGKDFIVACTQLVGKILDFVPTPSPIVVMGYAETAVGMGQEISSILAASFFQSTRKELPHPRYIEFTEPHSHATDHHAYVIQESLITHDHIVVLVDDEVSTGVTLANTIRALHKKKQHPLYVVATFLDARTSSTALEDVSQEINTPVHVVSLTRAHVHLPDDIIPVAASIIERSDKPQEPQNHHGRRLTVTLPEDPRNSVLTSYTGCSVDQTQEIEYFARRIALSVQQSENYNPLCPVHVVGLEEETFLAAHVALALKTTFSSTTRSPIFVVDEPGYPVRWKHEWLNNEGEKRWAYNLPRDGQRILLLPDDIDGTQEMLQELEKDCSTLFVVRLPR